VVIFDKDLRATEGLPAVRDLPGIRRLSPFEADLFMVSSQKGFLLDFPHRQSA